MKKLILAIAVISFSSASVNANAYHVSDQVLSMSVSEYAKLGMFDRHGKMKQLVESEEIKYEDLNACLIQLSASEDADNIKMKQALFACIRIAKRDD